MKVKEFFENVKEKFNHSAKDIAEKLDVTEEEIRNFAEGKKEISMDTLAKLEKKMDDLSEKGKLQKDYWMKLGSGLKDRLEDYTGEEKEKVKEFINKIEEKIKS